MEKSDPGQPDSSKAPRINTHNLEGSREHEKKCEVRRAKSELTAKAGERNERIIFTLLTSPFTFGAKRLPASCSLLPASCFSLLFSMLSLSVVCFPLIFF